MILLADEWLFLGSVGTFIACLLTAWATYKIKTGKQATKDYISMSDQVLSERAAIQEDRSEQFDMMRKEINDLKDSQEALFKANLDCVKQEGYLRGQMDLMKEQMHKLTLLVGKKLGESTENPS